MNPEKPVCQRCRHPRDQHKPVTVWPYKARLACFSEKCACPVLLIQEPKEEAK
jgi:hypothetical protein